MANRLDLIKVVFNQTYIAKGEEPMEIERKFLVGTVPENLDQYPNKIILQGYIVIAPDGTEVRLRQKGGKFFQTVKSGSGKAREEYETEIAYEQFDALWPATEGKRVKKIRYEIPLAQGTAELDEYYGDLNGLLTVEVEFKSEKESNEFSAPLWFGKEVTEDKRYKNQNLALDGVPS